MLVRILGATALSLFAGQALAWDPGKAARYPSLDLFRPEMDRFAVHGDGSTGNLSNTCTKAAGSDACRAQADRAADTTSVTDQPGADSTGSADNAGAFTKAVAAARARATASGSVGAILLPPGSYRMGLIVDPGGMPIMGWGSVLPSGGLPGPVDYDTSLNRTGSWQYRQLKAPGNANVSSANEWNTYLFSYVPKTNSPAGYEKGTLQVVTQCADPSDYPSISRDCVAADMSVVAVAGNTTASMSTMNPKLHFNPGSQGHGSVMEFDIFNDTGVDASPYPVNLSTTKIGLNIYGYGANRSTAAMVVDKASTNFQDGVVITQQSVEGTGFALRNTNVAPAVDVFSVAKNGDVVTSGTIQAAAVKGSVNASVATGATTQASAPVLSTDISVITYTASNSAGVTLGGIVGQTQQVFARTNSYLVWPPAGAQIESNGINNPITMNNGDHATFVRVSATQVMRAP